MKILVCHRPGGAFAYITDGWINALRDRGHRVDRWDGVEATWHDFAPDLYIGCSGHKQPIPLHHNAQVAIHVNSYGPVTMEGLNEPEKDITWVLQQRPNAVFGYGHEEDRLLWSYWTTKHGIPWVPMPTAGDRIVFKQTTPVAEREFDLVYLGGRWPYKAQTIDAYLLPLFKSGFKAKLHGWGDWPKGICAGPLGDDRASDFLNSGKVGPCISEKHTHTHGIDLPERAFKVALCGALVVHDAAMGVRRMIPSAVVATTPQQFRDYVNHFCRPEGEAERVELVTRQQREVLSAHTYHHRMATLFAALGLNEESEGMLS